MSFFSKMAGKVTGVVSSVFGSDDVMNKKDGHLANIGAWIGNSKFTTEEMAELDAKTAEGVRKFVIETLTENTERSKTRRDMAKFIMRFYCILVFMCVIVFPFKPEWGNFILNVASGAGISGAFISVVVFFFGSHWQRTARGGK